jgi:Predicted signal-transduction protein containing cAMP-binding and CBS domains
MTVNPSCCLTTDTVYQAAQLMKSEDVGPIPIVNDPEIRKLEGIITDRDIVLKVVAEGRDPNTTRVSEIMSKDVFTCRVNDDAHKATHLMEEHQVRRVPIVNENGQLAGIVSQADVATRMGEPANTAEVVKEISQAA